MAPVVKIRLRLRFRLWIRLWSLLPFRRFGAKRLYYRHSLRFRRLQMLRWRVLLTFRYAWDFGNGRTSTNAMPDADYTNVDRYPVSVTVSYEDFTGCSSEASGMVEIIDPPTITLTRAPDIGQKMS